MRRLGSDSIGVTTGSREESPLEIRFIDSVVDLVGAPSHDCTGVQTFAHEVMVQRSSINATGCSRAVGIEVDLEVFAPRVLLDRRHTSFLLSASTVSASSFTESTAVYTRGIATLHLDGSIVDAISSGPAFGAIVYASTDWPDNGWNGFSSFIMDATIVGANGGTGSIVATVSGAGRSNHIVHSTIVGEAAAPISDAIGLESGAGTLITLVNTALKSPDKPLNSRRSTRLPDGSFSFDHVAIDSNCATLPTGDACSAENFGRARDCSWRGCASANELTFAPLELESDSATPSPSSPLIDAGTDPGLWTDRTIDVFGGSRPLGASWDIGAVEVQP